VRLALRLDTQLLGSGPGSEETEARRAGNARRLLRIAEILERRLAAAPLGEDGVPLVPGLPQRPGSPLAGALEDVPPFGNIDIWRTIAASAPPELQQGREETIEERSDGRDAEVEDDYEDARERGRDVAEHALPYQPDVDDQATGAQRALEVTADILGELAGSAIAGVASAIKMNIDFFLTLDEAYHNELMACRRMGARLALEALDEWATNYDSPPIPRRFSASLLESVTRRYRGRAWIVQISSAPQLSHSGEAEQAMRDGLYPLSHSASAAVIRAERRLRDRLGRDPDEQELFRFRGRVLGSFASGALERLEETLRPR
jgi:hypothetical protein